MLDSALKKPKNYRAMNDKLKHTAVSGRYWSLLLLLIFLAGQLANAAMISTAMADTSPQHAETQPDFHCEHCQPEHSGCEVSCPVGLLCLAKLTASGMTFGPPQQLFVTDWQRTYKYQFVQQIYHPPRYVT